jgi:hypothetical protein
MKGLINQQRQLGGSSIRRSSATKKLCNSAPKAMALTRSFLGRSGPSQGHPTSQKGTPRQQHQNVVKICSGLDWQWFFSIKKMKKYE